MTKGMDHYREKILENCPIDVVAASNTSMMPYPYRLGHVEESSPTIASRSERYILDSNINSEDTTTRDVLDRGEYLGADWVAPVDVIGDPMRTTSRITKMFKMREEYEYSPKILIPLQSDSEFTHVEHYYHVSSRLADMGYEIDSPIAVGGVKDKSSRQQIEAVMDVREAVGEDIFIHLLGGGCSVDWVVTVRELPDLVDSVDMTTVVKNIVSGNRLMTPTMEYVDYDQPRGTNSTVMSSMLREYVLYLLNYLMGPDIRESDAPSLSDANKATQDLIRAWKGIEVEQVVESAAD